MIRIVESEPDFIVALLVDIGKSLKKDRYDLYILDDEILGVPALSMPVKLDKTCEPSSGGWDKEVVEILRQLTEPSPDLQLFVTETGKVRYYYFYFNNCFLTLCIIMSKYKF